MPATVHARCCAIPIYIWRQTRTLCHWSFNCEKSTLHHQSRHRPITFARFASLTGAINRGVRKSRARTDRRARAQNIDARLPAHLANAGHERGTDGRGPTSAVYASQKNTRRIHDKRRDRRTDGGGLASPAYTSRQNNLRTNERNSDRRTNRRDSARGASILNGTTCV